MTATEMHNIAMNKGKESNEYILSQISELSKKGDLHWDCGKLCEASVMLLDELGYAITKVDEQHYIISW